MRAGKRAFDLVCSGIGLIVLAPLLLLVSTAIWLEDRGSVFFRQERIGLRGHPFRMWKFRTMVVDAEARGGQLTIGDDSRITHVGRWLRRLKLDELPQLVNVIAGNMSLVGPRPEVGRYTKLYTEEQRKVLELVPGITDPASIRYRDEGTLLAQADDPERLYVECIMPDKIRINLEYAGHATVVTDFVTVSRTIMHILNRSGRTSL